MWIRYTKIVFVDHNTPVYYKKEPYQKWCQNAIVISPEEPKLKTIKSLIPSKIYENLKAQIKKLFPVQACLIKQLMSRGPRRDYAVQGYGFNFFVSEKLLFMAIFDVIFYLSCCNSEWSKIWGHP